MSRRPPSRELDDAAVDAIVDGGPVDAGHDRLATFARLVRAALLDVPVPRPSPDLAALLRDEATSEPAPGPGAAEAGPVPVRPGRRGRPVRRVAGRVARVTGLGWWPRSGWEHRSPPPA